MHDYATRVVRDTVYGSAKFHIGTGPRTSACGAEPSCPGIWPNSGSRDDFERLCPERICKRCRNAEAKPNPMACERCGQSCVTVEQDGYSWPMLRTGAIVCLSCQDRERDPQGEAVRLFTPAPNQIQGQMSF